MNKGLLVDRESAVVTLTLDRPGAANALDRGLTDALGVAVALAAGDRSVKVLVIRGSDAAFCGGGDLYGMAAADDRQQYIRSLADDMHDVLLRLARSHLWVIGVVEGPAAGAGLGIVLNCDFVLATPGASFVAAYGRVGLTPDCGVSYLLPRFVGPRQARQMLHLNRRLSATEALRWGIIDSLVDPEDLHSRLGGLVDELLAGVDDAARETRRLASTIDIDAYQRHLADEAKTIAASLTHPESYRRVASFAGRVRPT